MNVAMTNSTCQASAYTMEQIRMNNNNYLPGSMTEDSHHNMMGINNINEPARVPAYNTPNYSLPLDGSQLCNPGQICSTGNQTWVGQQGLCENQGSSSARLDRSVHRDIPETGYPNLPVFTSSAVHNFTFITPTQSSLQSPALVSYTQPRYQGSRTITHSFAPVGFTQWQHSIPQRIPWSSTSMGSTANVSIFTGSSAQSAPLQFSHPVTSWTSITSGPVASCSEEPKRPKRHASEDLQFLGPSKVHLTEERFAKHMEDLSIQCMATDKNTISNGVLQASIPPDRGGQEHQMLSQNIAGQNSLWKQWENFQQLEESLEVSDEEGDSRSCDNKRRKTPPTIHMVKDLDKLLANPDIIPKNILAEIRRPRMELVLYSPPPVDETPKNVEEETDNSIDQTKSTATRYQNKDEDDVCMEIECDDDEL